MVQMLRLCNNGVVKNSKEMAGERDWGREGNEEEGGIGVEREMKGWGIRLRGK